jgi:hypothetical protein
MVEIKGLTMNSKANYTWEESDLGGKFFVIESSTDQIVYSTFNKKEAIKQCNFLNAGGGFNGFTPGFLVKKNG